MIRRLWWRLVFALAFGSTAFALWRRRWLAASTDQAKRDVKLALFTYVQRFRPNHLSIAPIPWTHQGNAFRNRVLQDTDVPPPATRRVATFVAGERRLRIACVGRFSGALSFGLDFFRGLPPEIDTHIFEFPFEGGRLTALGDLPVTYHEVENTAQDLVSTVNGVEPDLIVSFWSKLPVEIANGWTAPTVAHVAGGSNVLPFEAVDLQILGQLTPAQKLVGNNLVCRITDSRIGPSAVKHVGFVYDRRDIEDEPLIPWQDREDLIFSFGSLFKFTPMMLNTVADLLRQSPTTRFVFMGRARGNEVVEIQDYLAQQGLASRVSYEGTFSSTKAPDGSIPDPGWKQAKDLLRRSRVALDTFPNTGGSARFEAYLLGCPFAYMDIPERIGFGEAKSYVDYTLPVLDVPTMAANDPAALVQKVLAGLSDPVFADDIAAQQFAVAGPAGDSARWWRDFIEAAGFGSALNHDSA